MSLRDHAAAQRSMARVTSATASPAGLAADALGGSAGLGAGSTVFGASAGLVCAEDAATGATATGTVAGLGASATFTGSVGRGSLIGRVALPERPPPIRSRIRASLYRSALGNFIPNLSPELWPDR